MRRQAKWAWIRVAFLAAIFAAGGVFGSGCTAIGAVAKDAARAAWQEARPDLERAVDKATDKAVSAARDGAEDAAETAIEAAERRRDDLQARKDGGEALSWSQEAQLAALTALLGLTGAAEWRKKRRDAKGFTPPPAPAA